VAQKICLKSWRMRILGARIFLSFLARNLKKLTWVTLRVNLGSQDKFGKDLMKKRN